MVATLLSSACSTPSIVNSKGVVEVEVDGHRVFVAPMPDKDSFGATRFAGLPFLPPNPATESQLLLRAVALATGCTVVTSFYNQGMVNLYATVRCP